LNQKALIYFRPLFEIKIGVAMEIWPTACTSCGSKAPILTSKRGFVDETGPDSR
jgi:hypothetical protein